MEKSIKAVAVSDTHGNYASLGLIAKKYAGYDYLFHMGDFAKDAAWLKERMPNVNVIFVRGNCDAKDDGHKTEEVVIQGKRIILTHGNKLHVKYGYDCAWLYAQEKEADCLLFGHTHVPYAEYDYGLWLVNPGTAGDMSQPKLTVAVILISSVGIIPKITPLDDSPDFL